MRKLITLLAVAALTIASVTETQAAFVAGLTGSSAFTGSRTGAINFSTYQNIGGTGNWITDLGLGGVKTDIPGIVVPPFVPGNPAATGLERNVFFFQIARTDIGDTDAILTFTAPFADAFTSIGFLMGTTFGPGLTSFLGSGTVNNPVTGLGTTDNGSNGGEILFTTDPLLGGDTSAVLFFTTNSSPLSPTDPVAFPSIVGTGGVDGGITMNLPTSNPEPGSLILLSMGMAGVVGYRRRKKKLELLEEEATKIDT